MSQVDFIACPFCNWQKPVKYGFSKKTMQTREVRFDSIDPARVKVLQTREMRGAGRGSPDAKIEIIDYTNLPDLPADLKEQVRSQCQKILDSLES